MFFQSQAYHTHSPPCSSKHIATSSATSKDKDDDIDLIRRVAAHDQKAFELIYQRYARRLTSYLTRLFRSSDLVEDQLHEVMLTIWQNAGSFQSTAQPYTWILGIARYKALKVRDRANRQRPDEASALAMTREVEDPEVSLAWQEQAALVRRAIATLPPTQRRVIELIYFQQSSYREIAERLGCSVSAVKMRMFAARRHLLSVFKPRM